MNTLLVFTVFFCSLWVLMFVAFAWTLKKVPVFTNETKGQVDSDTSWPRLSIIVPACNEDQKIEQAIQSLLDQDYPNLEIITINDRSTDETGAILDRLAEKNNRLRVLHLEELPSGWLGKVNAMHQGVKQASGEWYLFTDADVCFSPGLLRRAITFSQKKNINHLALLPKVVVNNFWLEVCITSFGVMFLLSSRAVLVNRSGSKTPIGIGAFNLVEKEIFDRTPGFKWLRLEPADDYGLGVMINKAGGQTHFTFADQELTVPWYDTIREMFRGLEKNMFGPGAYYSLLRLLLLVLVLWSLLVAPGLALISGVMNQSWLLLVSGVLAIGSHLAVSLMSFGKARSESIRLLLFPVGLLVISFMFLWSGYRCMKNGGIDWRGTHYPLAELRAGQRVKF